VMRRRGGWILKVDIQSYFDTIDHHHLRHILDQRVRDGVMRRTIDKWLNAGVLARIFHKKAQTSCKSLIEWYV
jgi:RNA-directed DNA polymerase